MIAPLTKAQRKKLDGKLVVASVSGGKDSAAMSLWLTENEVEHRRVFADTGWEHEKTYEYLRGPLAAKLGPIEEVRGKYTFEELCLHKGMFPSRTKRFCTQFLKIFPLFAYMNALAESGLVVNAVGIRWAESEARRAFKEWDESEGLDAEVWRPLLAWTEQDVIDMHARHGLPPNPLYRMGARRVGCWPCLFAAKDEVRLVADRDPARIDRIRALEEAVTAGAAKRIAASGEAERDAFTSMFTAVSGDRQRISIDDAVKWSRTERGGKQLGIFAPPADAGCARWGMCEPPSEPPP